MGKTSKQSPSQHKMSRTKSTHNISRNKKHKKLKKQFKHKRKSIQHLFQKLKNQSIANFQNDSIVFRDVDYHNTPPLKEYFQKFKNERVSKFQNDSIAFHDNDNTPIKKKRKHSVIIIDDETVITETSDKKSLKNNQTTTPICSTPKDKLNITTKNKPIIINEEPNLPVSSTPNKNDNNLAFNKDLNISNVSVANKANINNNLDIINLNNDVTKEINKDSYLTIDLTTESNNIANAENTVIDLDKLDTDCSFLSANSSMSGDSEVTVIRASLKKNKDFKNDTKMRKFAEGIAQLNATEKGRLLSLITENIFNGCKLPEAKKPEVIDVEQTPARAPETAEDTYIKEIILGQKCSRNSIGSNIYNPVRQNNNRTGLRMIVIDGSNVAMEHGKGRIFSVQGLKICIDFFLKRGHTVKAFVPRFRCKYGKSSLPKLLDDLERRGYVVFTPSREVRGRNISSYDDRYIVQCAAEFEGVIVSGDNYRDLLLENPRWRQVIETRLLQFTWVNDMIMFPKDPLGRNGPTLEQFLRH